MVATPLGYLGHFSIKVVIDIKQHHDQCNLLKKAFNRAYCSGG